MDERYKIAVMRKKTVVGLDFDGVVAYNPFRVIRAPIKWFKRRVMGVRKLSFFVPKNWWQRAIWTVLHESSLVPAKGIGKLREMKQNGDIEVHLITARYGFLKGNLDKFLDKHQIRDIFTSINVNENYEQPHLYKERMVKSLKLDVYVEDNLDIVTHIHGKVKAKVLWIYNFLDRNHSYPYKYPYLEKALEDIKK